MPPSVPVRPRPATQPRRALPAALFVSGGTLAVLLYAFGPVSWGLPLFMVIAVGSVTATVVGTLRHPDRAARRPWWALAGANTCFLISTVLRVAVGQADPTGLPGTVYVVPDLIVVPGYLLLGAALYQMLGRRRAGDDDPARADALLLGLGAALATWAFVIAPRLGGQTVTASTVALALLPMADVALMVMVARLMLADGVRQWSLWLLGAANAGMFVGDLLYSVQVDGAAAGAGTPGLIIEVAYLSAYVAIGGAVLHPTMRTLTEPQRVVVNTMGPMRAAGLAALLLTPTALATLVPAPDRWNGLVRLGFAALLTVTIIVRIVSNHNSRSSAEQQARHRATHDALTGLPNRELLTDTVTSWCDRATADGQQISLLFLDLDRFKVVNDRWGHVVGDELLCAVAGRLSGMVRQEDLVCRIGADEFVVAMASPDHGVLAEALARRLVEEFAEPFHLSIGDLIVTPSIGIARSDGSADALDLIRDADTAMYRVKGSGRNGYAMFTEPMREQVRRRADLEQALRTAQAAGELSVQYQPIVTLADGQLSGFEALMRWHHPELGFVSPLEFIPIAEDTGLIVGAGAWLLEEAAEQLARWRAERPAGSPPLHMSVNISVRQLRDGALVPVVRDILDRTGLPASALWLEITESGVFEDPEVALATLRQLRGLGVTLCIDDFGTGYSSLTYLKQFPATIVKIDRSFVSGIGTVGDDEAIVRTVIAMAHALGRQVVAEGVETFRHRDLLRELGCDLAQGYLYSPPRPADAHRALIAGAAPAVEPEGPGGAPVTGAPVIGAPVTDAPDNTVAGRQPMSGTPG